MTDVTPLSPEEVWAFTDEMVEAVYVAYDLSAGGEAKTIAGKRRIVEPIIRAVIDYEAFRAARVPAPADGLREALEAIAHLTTDVPAAHGNPESFYRDGLHRAIGTAARALASAPAGGSDALRNAALDAITKAEAKLFALCSGKERWVMRVPAEPDNDPDLVFAAAFAASRRYIDALGEAPRPTTQEARP